MWFKSQHSFFTYMYFTILLTDVYATFSLNTVCKLWNIILWKEILWLKNETKDNLLEWLHSVLLSSGAHELESEILGLGSETI